MQIWGVIWIVGKVLLAMSLPWVVLLLVGCLDFRKVLPSQPPKQKYMAILEASKEMIWLKNFLKELRKKQDNSALFCDSQSAIHLAKNSAFHARTKHIQLRYHHICGRIDDGILSLKKILGSKNLVDMLTKVVATDKLRLCITSIGLHG